jgi:hypothetical protein
MIGPFDGKPYTFEVRGKTLVGGPQFFFVPQRPGLIQPVISAKNSSVPALQKPIHVKPHMKPKALQGWRGLGQQAAPSEPPFLSMYGVMNKDKKMMLAWWDEIKAWEKANPGQKLNYPDLENIVAESKNPNVGVDRWLDAMTKAVPEDVIRRGERNIDSRWLSVKAPD